MTSPPYNLGIAYRSYDDTIPRDHYLAWTSGWIAAASRALAEEGSLFLNVGAKPTDPWTALDVAQAVRPHLQLQNTIHWIKSIAIDKAAAGARAAMADDLAIGHYKPINSRRYVNDCHEFIFHFSPGGRTRLDRRAVGVPDQDAAIVQHAAHHRDMPQRHRAERPERQHRALFGPVAALEPAVGLIRGVLQHLLAAELLALAAGGAGLLLEHGEELDGDARAIERQVGRAQNRRAAQPEQRRQRQRQ